MFENLELQLVADLSFLEKTYKSCQRKPVFTFFLLRPIYVLVGPTEKVSHKSANSEMNESRVLK